MRWWALAGVDSAVSETPVNWLRPVLSPTATARALNRPAPADDIPPDTLPNRLDAFHAWLADSPVLQEAAWAGPRILPSGPAAVPLMVVCDMPDIADGERGALLSGDAGELFDAMLAAIGLARENIYLSSLALTRPPGGILSDTDEAILAARMRHHIKLAGPRRLLLLGERTNRALMTAGATQRISGLRSVNHGGGTVEAIAIRHPRFLLKQPTAKADSWRALQYLIEDEPS